MDNRWECPKCNRGIWLHIEGNVESLTCHGEQDSTHEPTDMIIMD